MSEIGSYHGWCTPAAYKQGERNYHFLKKSLQEWDKVTAGFMWPDQELERWVPVKGPVETVLRHQEAPYARFSY